MECFKQQFNEDTWTVYLVEDEDYVVIDEGAGAVTDFNDKELFFRRGDISKEIIRHELFHVYFGYCFLGDTTELGLSDMEEIAAALIAHKYDQIGKVSDELYKKLCKLRDKKKRK